MKNKYLKILIIILVVAIVLTLIYVASLGALRSIGEKGMSDLNAHVRDNDRRTALETIYTEVEAFRGDTGYYPAAIQVNKYLPDATQVELCSAILDSGECIVKDTKVITLNLEKSPIRENSRETKSNSTETIFCYSKASDGLMSIGVLLESSTPFYYGSGTSCWDVSTSSIPLDSPFRIK